MPAEVMSEADIDALARGPQAFDEKVLTADEILALDVPEPEMLIEGMLPKRGASLINGAPKAGKTVFSIQLGIAIATGSPLFGFYRVLQQGPVFVLEQDDPAATASVKPILQRSRVSVKGAPFHLAGRSKYTFGPDFLAWLEEKISTLSLRLAVLDSYTGLRSARPKHGDLVKAEQTDLTELDALGKRRNCSIAVLHHASKGSSGLHWSQQAAGSYAMSAATESQIFISRFPDLDGPERLVCMRGRHFSDLEMVLKFREESLDYEHILEGPSASVYPLVLQIRNAFGTETFGPQELLLATGVSRPTAHRHIDKLHRAGALVKRGFGQYSLSAVMQ